MKTLAEHVSLEGEIEMISATDLRGRVGDCLTQVSLGKILGITRNGKVVAFLVPSRHVPIVHEIHSDGSSSTLDLPMR